MTRPSELREMEPDELDMKLTDARQEMFNLRFQHVTGQLDNYARLRDVRRDIARMNTVLRQKEIQAAEAGYDDAAEAEDTGPVDEAVTEARRARVLGSRRAAARAARQEGREDA